tara:strand:- start:1668 stop:1973 length:306 start_codon:yes stop_codon:yes gene_type:complete
MSNKGFLMVRMPESLKSKLVEDASNVGVSMSALLEIMIKSCPDSGPNVESREVLIRSGFSLSPESRSRLKEMSDLSGRSCSAVINQLIKDFAGIEVLNENR